MITRPLLVSITRFCPWGAAWIGPVIDGMITFPHEAHDLEPHLDEWRARPLGPGSDPRADPRPPLRIERLRGHPRLRDEVGHGHPRSRRSRRALLPVLQDHRHRAALLARRD